MNTEQIPREQQTRDSEGIEHHVGAITLKRMAAFVQSEKRGRGL